MPPGSQSEAGVVSVHRFSQELGRLGCELRCATHRIR